MTLEKDETDEEEDIQTGTYEKVRKISISLPNDLAEKAEQYATEHQMKRSQVLALAIERGLGDENRVYKKLNRIEALIKKNNRMAKSTSKDANEIEDEKTSEEIVLTNEQRESIENLLVDCTSMFSAFEIMGADGFLVQVQERQLLRSIWTDETLEILANKLSAGYDDWYLNKPEPQDLIDACADAMILSEDQKNKLIEYFAAWQRLEVKHTESKQTGEEESEEKGDNE